MQLVEHDWELELAHVGMIGQSEVLFAQTPFQHWMLKPREQPLVPIQVPSLPQLKPLGHVQSVEQTREAKSVQVGKGALDELVVLEEELGPPKELEGSGVDERSVEELNEPDELG